MKPSTRLPARLVESGQLEGSKIRIRLSDLRHSAARESVRDLLQQNPQEEVVISVKPVTPEKGDADNLLWALDFPGAQAKTAPERPRWAFAELFVSTGPVLLFKSGDLEMRAASDKARRAFFAQETRFQQSLNPSEK